MKILISAVVVAALLLLSNAHASSRIFWTLDRSETHRLVKERDAWKRSAKLNASLARRYQRVLRYRWQAGVMHAITLASVIYRVPRSQLIRVGRCESGLRVEAVNGRYRSVFQEGPMFEAGPFGRAGFSAFDPYANVFTAALTVHQEGWKQWQCQP